MSVVSSGSNPEDNGPEFWQLNYMKGTFAEPRKVEDIVRDYAAAEDPDALDKPHIALPPGKLHLQVPLNRRLRSERDSETYLKLSDCMFIVESVLEAQHHHEETAGFRTFHTLGSRRTRLEREIIIRPDEVQDYTDSYDTFTLSALGSLYLPESLQGQVIADSVIPEKIDGTKFSYGGYLPGQYTIYGGFHTPIYQ